MLRLSITYFIVVISVLLCSRCEGLLLRPPSVPLIVTDPYFSVWSNTDNLTDDWSRFWSSKPMAMQSMIRVDERPYRLMGGASSGSKGVPPMQQIGFANVTATRTLYRFEGGGVSVELSFLQPIFATNMSTQRPLSYIQWDVKALDGKHHSVQLYFDVDAEIVTNSNSEYVSWHRAQQDEWVGLVMGSEDQKVLGMKGASNHINWGYLYTAYETKLPGTTGSLNAAPTTRFQFAKNGTIPSKDDTRMPRIVSDSWIVAAVTFDCSSIADGKSCSRNLCLAYDDIASVEYDGQHLPAYWKAGYPASPADAAVKALISDSIRNRLIIQDAAKAFDEDLARKLQTAGGEQFKEVAVLSYRQTVGANQLAGWRPTSDSVLIPLHFSRECGSGDDILTMDVVIDSLPFFLFFNPDYIFAELTPIVRLAENQTRTMAGATIKWLHPYTPHDMGKYPIADAYNGGSQEIMQIEETGNLMVMVAAACARKYGMKQGCQFAAEHWDTLHKWSLYLADNGLYPELQLSSDDFDGPLANRSNLAVKAVIGVGAFSQLARQQKEDTLAKKFESLATDMMSKWLKLADAGDHFALQYGQQGPDSWGMLYNWWLDELLEKKLIPTSAKLLTKVFYQTKMQGFGLPLGPRHNYTIQPWMTWVHSMDVYSKAEFEKLFATTFQWVHNTPDRWPLADWYRTDKPKRVGFEARSMWGGIYSRLFSRQSETTVFV